jgi:hypothetical protein
MTVYALYTLFFLFLLLKKKGVTHAFCLTENETKVVLLGLAVYTTTYLISSALIRFDLKVETYRIFSHHVILLGACLFFCVKMIKDDGANKS